MTVPGYATDTLVSAELGRSSTSTTPKVRSGRESTSSTTASSQSHLPGAVGWNWTSQLADNAPRHRQHRASASWSRDPVGRPTIALYSDNNKLVRRLGLSPAEAARQRRPDRQSQSQVLSLNNRLPLTADMPSYPPTG